MSVEVGRKLVLWRIVEIRENAWIDELGNSRWVVVVGEQIPVTVTKVEISPPRISGGRQIEKLDAISESGVVYTRHHQEEHSHSDIGHICVWMNGENEFHDACCSYNNRITPYITTEAHKAIPLGATICKTHGYAYMPDDPAGCLYC